MFRRIAALVMGVFIAAGLAMAGHPARATTATCLNIATPISQPIGCGGLYFSGLGTGIQPNGTSLTLTAPNPQWNSHVVTSVYDPARSDQDWTIYQRCTAPVGAPGTRTEANPCGTGSTAVLDPDGQAEFVAEATPLGHHLGGALNTPGNLCLSVEAVFNGPLHNGHHALRWRTVLRTCDTLGAVFYAGQPDPGAPNPPNSNAGITGVVSTPNFWQTWSPFGPVGSGPSAGFVFANNALSGNVFNHKFVLDDPASAVAGAWLLAYPENDNANQTARIIGCTGAPNQITPGHFDCP